MGSVLMRSAGCIFNDIVDKDFDAKVKLKTDYCIWKDINIHSFYVIILCALAFLILYQFNFLTILLGLGSMIFAFSYPFMKGLPIGLSYF